MRFCEKLKDARTKAGMKQEELAKALGVSLRTITNYESGECYPRKRDIYHKLAELFHTEENYFLNEDEEFLLSAAEKYGAKGAKQAQALVDEVSGLFAGGNIADEDLDVMMMKRKARENRTLLQIGLHRLIRLQVSFKLVAS